MATIHAALSKYADNDIIKYGNSLKPRVSCWEDATPSPATNKGPSKRRGTSESVSSTSSGSSGVSTCDRAKVSTTITAVAPKRRARNTKARAAVKTQILSIHLPPPKQVQPSPDLREQASTITTARLASDPIHPNANYTLIPERLGTRVLIGWKKRNVLNYFGYSQDTGVLEVEARLKQFGPGLYGAIKAVRLTRPFPTSKYRHQVNLMCGLSGDQPTHVLMVVEKRNYRQVFPNFVVPGPISAMSTATYPEKQRQRMFPVHDLILHMNCGRIPPGFLSDPIGSSPHNAGDRITVPTKEFAVPSIAAFSLLHEWMYTKHPIAILSKLLPGQEELKCATPEEPLPNVYKDDQWGEEDDVDLKRWGYLASRVSNERLLQLLSMTYATWETIWVLGIDNKELSKLIDLCWQLLINALQRKLRAEGKNYNFGMIHEGMPGSEAILNAFPWLMDGQLYLSFSDLEPRVLLGSSAPSKDGGL